MQQNSIKCDKSSGILTIVKQWHKTIIISHGLECELGQFHSRVHISRSETMHCGDSDEWKCEPEGGIVSSQWKIKISHVVAIANVTKWYQTINLCVLFYLPSPL